MKHGTLLVVDDNRNILTTVKMVTEQTFERIICLASPSSLLTRLREDQPDVVLLDMNFHSGINNGNEGLYWLREIKKARPQTAVVLFTAYADIELAVTGLKDGAADFIVKPFDNHQLIEKLTDAYQKTRKKKPTITAVSEMIWGTSPAMRHLRDMVEKVAGTDANIMSKGPLPTPRPTSPVSLSSLRAARSFSTRSATSAMRYKPNYSPPCNGALSSE